MNQNYSVIEFEGVPSGDYDCFCWDVTLNTFRRLWPDENPEHYKSFFYNNLYRFYDYSYELDDWYDSNGEDRNRYVRVKIIKDITSATLKITFEVEKLTKFANELQEG